MHAHENEIGEQLKSLQEEVDSANLDLERLLEEENALSEQLTIKINAIKEINVEIEENEKKCQDIYGHIKKLQQQRTNKVTAFGGDRVIRLLQAIERHHRRFKMPPIGPIGAHLALVNGDIWAVAIENAIGRLLNAFIVTDHKDSLLLRQCAKEANYQHLQIIIYDFDRPKLNIPRQMLPQTDHPTVLSVLRTDNPTIVNVLVDQGDAERQVLVRDYGVGKSVVFESRIPNLKEVYTLEGYRMFSRGNVQTVLPPNRRIRTGRLCSSIEGQINGLERDALKVQELVKKAKGKKRYAEEACQDLRGRAEITKRRRLNAEKDFMSKKITLQDLKDSSEATSVMEPNVDELNEEIMKAQEEIQEKELSLEMLREKLAEAEAKANDLKLSFETLCESAKVECNALGEAEQELLLAAEDLRKAKSEKEHYEGIMSMRVLNDIKVAETAYEDFQHKHQACVTLKLESYKKASIICPESEVEALGGCAGSTPEQLSAQVNRLNQRLQQETERFPESIDDLRLEYEKKERKIKKKQQTYSAFRDKLGACQKALDLRWNKFQRNATYLKQQLTWQFNGHLRRKGISGQIKINYEDKTLSIEGDARVKMPHDASSDTVRDTRGLSGGERSFSTLCFALSLHEMTESPIRAMDEFDVFMDAISRKISLDTLVDFAVTQGSQWIIITPNDISMVKPGERVKKQQMAAPRA
ncbi:hypothetical protein ACLOJK_033329 [Asimina triloba]